VVVGPAAGVGGPSGAACPVPPGGVAQAPTTTMSKATETNRTCMAGDPMRLYGKVPNTPVRVVLTGSAPLG
jgi:hypothetical protein